MKRAHTLVPKLSTVAVRAQDLKPGRELVLDEPEVEAVPATELSNMSTATTNHVVDFQDHLLRQATAPTTRTTVCSEHCVPELRTVPRTPHGLRLSGSASTGYTPHPSPDVQLLATYGAEPPSPSTTCEITTRCVHLLLASRTSDSSYGGPPPAVPTEPGRDTTTVCTVLRHLGDRGRCTFGISPRSAILCR